MYGWTIIILVIGVIRLYQHNHPYVLVVQLVVFRVHHHSKVVPVGPLLPLLRYGKFWTGIDLVLFIKKSANIMQNLVSTSCS